MDSGTSSRVHVDPASVDTPTAAMSWLPFQRWPGLWMQRKIGRSQAPSSRTATGARAVDGQLWTSTIRPTEAGGAVGVSLIDPSTGRHLHLEVERATITLRTDSRTATTPASIPATRAHLERVAEAYGHTHAELVSDLHVFAGTVLDHPTMRLVAEVC